MDNYDCREWSKQIDDGDLARFLAKLKTSEVTAVPLTTDRIPDILAFSDARGRTYQVDSATWLDVLDAAPPYWMHGSTCVQADGDRADRLLWELNDRLFLRRLTAKESSKFSRFVPVSHPE